MRQDVEQRLAQPVGGRPDRLRFRRRAACARRSRPPTMRISGRRRPAIGTARPRSRRVLRCAFARARRAAMSFRRHAVLAAMLPPLLLAMPCGAGAARAGLRCRLATFACTCLAPTSASRRLLVAGAAARDACLCRLAISGFAARRGRRLRARALAPRCGAGLRLRLDAGASRSTIGPEKSAPAIAASRSPSCSRSARVLTSSTAPSGRSPSWNGP